MSAKPIVAAGTGAFLLALASWALGPTFRPEFTFRGSSLDEWHTLGQAEWKAASGEITGKPTQPAGGWLVMNRSFQDVAIYAEELCAAGCKFGVLLRAEKTPQGMKGIYVSFAPDDLNSYAVTLDSEGRFTAREKLGRPRPTEITALGNNPGGRGGATTGPGAPAAGRGGGGRAPGLPPGVNLPMGRPTGEYLPGQWNGLEVLLAGHVVTPRINGGTQAIAGMTAAAEESSGQFGPIALYIGGTGEVRLKNVVWNDLLVKTSAPEQLSSHFSIRRLNEFYYSWSAAVADINRDGKPDVIAGPYYYTGPDFTEAHEIYEPVPYNPALDYPQNNMVSLAYDFTGDGWPDLLVMSGNAGNGIGTLYVNPKGKAATGTTTW